MKILITGANGFVGHHAVEHVLKTTDWDVVAMVRIDSVGDLHRLYSDEIIQSAGSRLKVVYHDLQGPIMDYAADRIGKPDMVLHLAANSHVDRSIADPRPFVMDNVVGTMNLLEFVRNYCPEARVVNFGTDEIFGPAVEGQTFGEDDPWNPTNPYSATKAGQIALGIAYHRTYGIPIFHTFCMNLFGERQHPEKLVAKAVRLVVSGRPVQIHSQLGEQGQVEYIGKRHWLYVKEAVEASLFLMSHGTPGERYNIVGSIELANDEMVLHVGSILGRVPILEYVDYHRFRPGHDRRYALSDTKLKKLGWKPEMNFAESLKKTVMWTANDMGDVP